MHEMSIAQSLIEAATEALDRTDGERVSRIHVRIGMLSGVVREALLFSFELAAEDTPCAGAHLEVEDVPITVHCSKCDSPQTVTVINWLCCPVCGTPTPEVLSGRELELQSIEIQQLQIRTV